MIYWQNKLEGDRQTYIHTDTQTDTKTRGIVIESQHP